MTKKCPICGRAIASRRFPNHMRKHDSDAFITAGRPLQENHADLSEDPPEFKERIRSEKIQKINSLQWDVIHTLWEMFEIQRTL